MKNVFPSVLCAAFAILACGVLTAGTEAAEPATLADRLVAAYDGVQSVTCDVRREEESPNGKRIPTLSRVYYQKPDRLHVDMTSPIRRRIVADGERFHSYVEGDPMGFSRPVEALDEEMRISLRKIPGTGLEHLMRLHGVREIPLEPEPGWPVRAGYDTGKVYAELRVDEKGRLGRVDLFSGSDRKKPRVIILFKDFVEGAPGAWFAKTHETVVELDGVRSRETARFDNLRVNGTIPPVLFVAAPYFKGVEFADTFEAIYR